MQKGSCISWIGVAFDHLQVRSTGGTMLSARLRRDAVSPERPRDHPAPASQAHEPVAAAPCPPP
ncbi:hypothetical protein T484DRAFT_1792487 [Baffinella frigidus]|nr:hypothetical protein T484DRAFT_1792487 [Cryptophyta sp. CCMP2293]